MLKKHYFIHIVLLYFIFSFSLLATANQSQTDSINIPENLGSIEGNSLISKDKRVVIHIQDAHCLYPVQKQIINIIEYLASEYNIFHIFVEGADKNLNADSIKSFPDNQIKKNVSEHFLKKGKISGVEYLAINDSSGIKAKGAEDKNVYRENYISFSESQAASDEIITICRQLGDVLKILKQEFYSPELLEIDSKEKAYLEGEETLRRYLNFVISKCDTNSIELRKLKNIVILQEIIECEKQLNYFLIEKEKNKLISVLQQKLTTDQKVELLDATLSYSVNKISPASLFNILIKFCDTNGIQIAQYPEIKKYTAYLKRSKQIDMAHVDSEINALTNNIRDKIIQNEQQQSLTKLDLILKTLKTITQLKASSYDLKFYSENKQWFLTNLKSILDESSSFSYPLSVTKQANTLVEKMRRFENFYACVFKRDTILVTNTIREMKSNKINMSILITGGFHSEGIEKELSKQGVSVISVRPNLLDAASGYKSNYTNAVLGTRNALENYLFLNWNALAVASVLVEGTPLVQQWKGNVYKRELEITQLALKLCALRTVIENRLGIKAGEEITNKIALSIASSLKQDADTFLTTWNTSYKDITGTDHPLLNELKTSIRTVNNSFFLELSVKGKKIFFPLETGLALDPGTLIDSFLTPEKFTSVLAANSYVRESIMSFQQIKNMRARVNDILTSKNSSSALITEEEKNIITDITRSITKSNPDIFGNRNINLNTDTKIKDIAEIINKAVCDIYVTRVSSIASKSLKYEDLFELTEYGSSAPLHFMLKTLKNEEPLLAAFFEYIIDNYSLFAPDQQINDIHIIMENMFDEFLLIKPEAAQLNLNSYFLNKITDIVYAGLKIGDAIRPHGIASAITYGLNLSGSMTFNEILEIHDIFEEESIYGVDEIIELILSSYYINSSIAKTLISKPLPFTELINILKSPELKRIKQNPTAQNFSFFINKFRDNLDESAILEIYTKCLDLKNPLRTALTSLLAQGWDANKKRSQRFHIIAAQQKIVYSLNDENKFNYDMVIIALLGYLPDELSMPDDKIAGVGIHGLDQLDSFSPYYDEMILQRFISLAALSGNKITILSLDPGFTSNLDEITTQSGLTLNRNDYNNIIYSYIQSVETPVMVYVDKDNVAAVEDKLNSLDLSTMVIIIPYDYKTKDISLAGEKRISFLGYWMNLVEILNKNFRGSLRLINANKNEGSRFDDFSRDYIDIETLIPQHGSISDETALALAENANSKTLETLILSGHINTSFYPNLVNNKNFNIDSLVTFIRDSELPATNDFFELIYAKFSLYELKNIFIKTQNLRATHFFMFLVQKNSDIVKRLYSDISTQDLINLFVLSQKLGFSFDENTIPDDRNDSYVIDFTYKTAMFSPTLASSLLTAYLNKSPDEATKLMQKLANSSLDNTVTKKLFTTTLKNYTYENPDFIELTPLFESDITPLWHKAFVLDHAITLKDNPEELQRYIYGILNIFNEQSDFSQWMTTNKEKHEDRVDQWLQVVSLYPEIHELRSAELLQSAIMIDFHILNSYREFVVKLSSKKEPYRSLHENMEIFQLIFKSVNSVFSSPIESKMYIFHILPFILDYLPENMSLEDIFNKYLEKTDRQGNIIQAGIPVYAILPAIIFAEGNTDILDKFKSLFSIDYISRSTSEKSHLVSSFLRIFASINHAYLYDSIAPEIMPSKDSKTEFLKILSLNTPETTRQNLLELFQPGKRTQDFITKQFKTAQLKYKILLKLTNMTASKTAKKDQKIINDVLDFLFILSENYEMLEQAPGKPNEKFDKIIDNFESYPNLRELKKDLMRVFAEFIRIDFPDVFESDEDVLEKLPKIEKIASFWIYKNDWIDENERGIELLRQAIHDYLLNGSSLKHIKYGGTPENAKQLELLEALLYNRILSRIQPDLQEDEAKKEALKLTAHYLKTWKTDSSETLDLSILPPAKSNESYVAWTSDEVPDWMNFGMSGGATCLAPGNISVYTKNLPGYIFSALVSGGLYFGKYKGDIRDRVNQALLPVVIDKDPHLFLVNQYYYSSGGQTGDQIGYASILASIRNAARYGADGIIIPTGSPQAGYLSSLEDFIQHNFSTVIDHRTSSGKLIKREKITVREINTETINLVVPKEPNQWRYFDTAKSYRGRYFEKLSENFSFIDFGDSVTHELAGVQFDGLEVETSSRILMLEREDLPIDKVYSPQETDISLSDTIKNFIQEGRLISLVQVNPEIKDNFKKLSFSERTTGKFLNNLLYLSEQLSGIVDQEFIQDKTENRFFVLSATQRALPIVRKLGTMLEGKDYVTGEINTTSIIDEKKPSRTVFIVDEGMLTGSIASKQIETVIENNDVLPEEIIFVSLTADPKAVERVLRKFPGIKMVVGMFEERTEQNGTVISSVIGDQITKDMLFDLSSNPKVTLNNVEYKIISQSSEAYNSFIAETETGEKVFLKTTVSAAEGKQVQQIWKLVEQSEIDLAVPQVYQYDEATGILAASYIDGPSFNEYINNSKKSPSELVINILDALRDASDVAQFLSREGALYVNITPNNMRLNLKDNKWYITNYSPFPYRVQPLEESGVLRQLEWILNDVLKNFQSYADEEITSKDKTAIEQLEKLLDKIKNGDLDKLYKFISESKKTTQSLLTPQNIFETYNFPQETTTALKTIFEKLILEQDDLENIYTSLRLNVFSGITLAGILTMYSNSATSSVDIQENLSHHVMDISINVEKTVPNFENAEYIFFDEDENLFSALYSDKPLKNDEISGLAEQTDRFKNNLMRQVELILDKINSGKPVVLAGNIETVKWVYNEIFNLVNEETTSLIYILPDLSQFRLPQHYNQVMLGRAVVSAGQLFFSRSFQRENQNFKASETSILNWNESIGLNGIDLPSANHIRERIIKNPRFNIFIRTPDKKLAGLMSAAILDRTDSPLENKIPETNTGGNTLFYYSLFIDSTLKNNASFKQILLDIQHHISLMHQYSESYRYYSPAEALNYLITHKYLPSISEQSDTDLISADLINNNNYENVINLFPNADKDMQDIILKSAAQIWKTNSGKLRNIFRTSGKSVFIEQIIEKITANILNQFPDKRKDEIIHSLFKISFSPVDFLSTSTPNVLGSDKDTQTAYKNYTKNLEDIYPLTEPLSKTIFERILKMPEGTEAFRLWLKHHDDELLAEWNNYINQTADKVPSRFVEKFGSALLSFLQFTGRPLLDKDISDTLKLTNGIISTIINSQWNDPLHPDLNNTGIGHGFSIRMPYIIGSEEDYLQNWFDRETAVKLNEFLNSLPRQRREQLIITILNMDFDHNYKNITKLIKSIFKSPLSNQSRAEIMENNFEKIAAGLMDFDDNIDFLIFDANSNVYPSQIIKSLTTSPNTVVLLAGDYKKVRKFYNTVNRYLTEDTKLITDINRRIIGLTPVIKDQPDFIRPFKPFLKFNMIDDSIASTKITSLPNIPVTNSAEDFQINTQTMGGIIGEIMGRGGLLSVAAEKLQKDPNELTHLDIIFESVIENNLFLKITLTFGEDQYEILARASLKTKSQLTQKSVTRDLKYFSSISDNILSPLPALTRRQIHINADTILDFSIFETYPAGTSVLSVSDVNLKSDDIQSELRRKKIIRKQAQNITRLWQLYGVVPNLNQSNFLIEELHDSISLYLLADPNNMIRADDETELFFKLFLHFGLEDKEEILKGIFDAFQGDTNLFNSFTSKIQTADFTNLIANEIQNATDKFLPSNTPKPLVNHIKLRIANLIKNSSYPQTDFDFTEIIPFLKNAGPIETSLAELNNYGNDITQRLAEMQIAISTFNDTTVRKTVSGSIENHLRHLENIFSTNGKTSISDNIETIESYIKVLEEQKLLTPAQLIEAQILSHKLLFSPEFTSPTGEIVKNHLTNQSLTTALDKIYNVIRNHPDALSDITPSIAAEANISLNKLWAMALPGFNIQTQTFSIENTQIHLSKLPLLIRTEKTLKSNPIILTTDSSSADNLALFQQVASLFKINILKPTITSATEHAIKNPDPKNSTNYDKKQKLLLLKQLLKNHVYPVAIDTSDKSISDLISYFRDDQIFEFSTVTSMESFLEHITGKFDDAGLDKLSFYLDPSILPDNFKDQQDTINRLIKTVVELRLMLVQAAKGDIEAKEKFVTYSKLMGIEDSCDELLISEQIKAPQITMTALILDKIKKSGKFPELSGFITSISESGKQTETKFLLLVDVYTNLALHFFAEKVARLAENGDIEIDVNSETITLSGKSLLYSGEDYKYIFSLLKEAKISVKTFRKNVSAQTIVKYAQSVIPSDMLFIHSASDFLVPSPEQKTKKQLNNRSYELIETAL